MHNTLQIRTSRLQSRRAELLSWSERAVVPISNWTIDGRPIAIGEPWPDARDAVRFAAKASVPGDWPLEETRLHLDLGGESLLTLRYPAENGATESFGLDPFHRRFPLLAREVEIAAESVARFPFGEPNPDPRLTFARLVRHEPAVDSLALLLLQIGEAADALDGHEVVPHLLEAAEKALSLIDWPTRTGPYVARHADKENERAIWHVPAVSATPESLSAGERASVQSAYDALIECLHALQKRFPQQGEIVLTGHAHIDLAWLWPYDETRRKTRRTFSTALSLMARSEDFRFNQSTAHYYAQIEQDDPELLDRIKAAAADGKWEPIGGLWIEPDTNMPTGESLVRQVLYGQRFFERTFGARHRVCWLPDCFGFSPALPQLLKQGGIDSFFTIKVNWNEVNTFPHDLFWWEGLDGSRVLAHTFDNPMQGYNGFVQPDCFVPTWRNFRQKTVHDTTLLAVGYGDGGGGATPEFVEREVQLRSFPAIPRARWGKVADFFENAHRAATNKTLPEWHGEIYLELHRGTLTTQGRTKRLHRQAERSLISAEALASLAHMLGGAAPQSLEPVWRTLLKNQFHDILPGSSIREVYVDAERELGEVVAVGMAVQNAAMTELAELLPKGDTEEMLLVANPTLDARPLDFVGDDGGRIAGAMQVPPLSIAVVAPSVLVPEDGLCGEGQVLENRYLKAVIDEDGSVASLIDKRTGREALDGAGNQLWVYVDKPRDWDAWDIDLDYESGGERLAAASVAAATGDAHETGIEVRYRFRNSEIVQRYLLAANARRLDIQTEIDWHDRKSLLRTLTPVRIRASRASFECAHGVIDRPTHANTSWDAAMFEAAAHRFVDLSEAGFGVALINNGKYGHNVRGNILGMSLVRGPIYPDPLADEGKHAFTYSLMPHAGAWYEGGVRQQAEALNQPLLVHRASGLASGTVSPLRLEGPDVALSALKPAEDGDGLILRVYEPAGGRGPLNVAADGWSILRHATLMEEDAVENAEIGPHEVATFRLRHL